jgi:cation diffusion facilitator CzcD-associated flavoprotein CzcO
MERTPLLIVGAGPYGLSTAACAKQMGIDHVLVGETMGFWRHNMPEGMLLRSGIDWQLDPFEVHTFRAFLRERGLSEVDVQPIPVELFIQYGEWFRNAYQLEVRSTLVSELCANEDHRLEARLSDGELIVAENVVAGPGVAHFTNIPEEVERSLDPARYSHTCTRTGFEDLHGSRLLIVGGRQSAFEWAALISECIGAEVHIVHDHGTPAFEASDWSFVDRLVENTVDTRGWFRHLPLEEREAISKRFWSEGRLKLEPWLAERIKRGNITDWPVTHVVEYRQEPAGEIVASLSNDQRLVVDHVILATGYRVRVPAVPYLARSHLARDLHTVDGCPVLDEDFQSSVPGLFFTGFIAARDFGPFLGFTRGCPAAARIIVAKVKARLVARAHAEQASAHARSLVESGRSRPSPHHDRPGPGAARAA